MNTSPPVRTSRRPAHGFSLVELIVGIAISLIGVLVMFRMVSLWDLHSRTTTSGGDAQVTGTLAIYSLERDIKPAGMGFGQATPPAMGCSVAVNDLLGPHLPTDTFLLQPVTITPGVPAGAPDGIDVLYGDSSFYVAQEPLQGSTAISKTLRRRNGFRPGDLAVVAGNPGAGFGSADCALVEITGAANPDNKTLDHGMAAYTSVYTGGLKAVRYNTLAGVGAGFISGMMYSLGPNPQLAQWRITTNANGISALSRGEWIFNSNTLPVDVAENVINLKAQYGVDTDGNGRITNNGPNEWTTVAPPDFTQVLAVRVAVLVRSRQFERSADGSAAAPTGITPIPPSWANGNFLMTNLDGTADSYAATPNNPNPNNWRFYRYRVYEKVIPLRNMIWGTSP